MKKLAVIAAISTALLAAFLLSGCEPKMIPGTKIKDTPETKALALLVVDKYRKAMEAKDVDTLISMVSSRFFENGGTPVPEDDYNADGLKKRLTEKFKVIHAITLDIVLSDIDTNKEAKTGYVRYHYFLKYLVKYPSEERWENQSDDAEMDFVMENGEWRVTRGM
jgi:hypothetical protein